MQYKAKPLTEERLIKAKELLARIDRSGVVPQRTHYYLADLIAEVDRLRQPQTDELATALKATAAACADHIKTIVQLREQIAVLEQNK